MATKPPTSIIDKKIYPDLINMLTFAMWIDIFKNDQKCNPDLGTSQNSQFYWNIKIPYFDFGNDSPRT